MTLPFKHPLRPGAARSEPWLDGRIVWRRPPETPRQWLGRVVGDVFAVLLGSAMWMVILANVWRSVAGMLGL